MIRLSAIVTLAACAADVPETPSFQLHVLPILAAQCVRCHGYPALGGAPPELRLDVYGDVVVRGGRPRDPKTEGVCGLEPADAEGVVCGAASYAVLAADRAGSTDRPMPPRFRIDDHQIETLARWAATAERGAPRPGNAVPTIAIEGTSQLGSIVSLRVRIDDADRDLVAGELRATVAGVERFVGPVRSGALQLAWDAAGVAPGSYPLTARLDDGAAQHVVDAGSLVIGGR